MGYDNSASSARQLEARFERLLLLIGDLQAAIGRLQQPSYNPAGGGFGGSGGGLWYCITATYIPAGGSIPGLTILVNIGGTLTATAYTNATVYNMMAFATVAFTGKTIVVAPNPDGTFSVISQSC